MNGAPDPAVSIPYFAERRQGGVRRRDADGHSPEHLGKAVAGMRALAEKGLR